MSTDERLLLRVGEKTDVKRRHLRSVEHRRLIQLEFIGWLRQAGIKRHDSPGDLAHLLQVHILTP